jgi:hypothetical protein
MSQFEPEPTTHERSASHNSANQSRAGSASSRRHRHRADTDPVSGRSRDEGRRQSQTVRDGSKSRRPIRSNHSTASGPSVDGRTSGSIQHTVEPSHQTNAPSREQRSPQQRRLRFLALSLLFIVALCAGSVIGETREARANEAARQSHTIARDALRARADLAGTVIVEAATHVESARTTLESPNATWLTGEERGNFEMTLSAADAVLREARLQVAEATRQASAPVPPEATVDQISAATATLVGWEFVPTTKIDALHQSLTDAVATVTVAIEQRQAEQNRIAAERAARELAAQQAAAEALARGEAEAAAAQRQAQQQTQAGAAGGTAPAPQPAASTTPPASAPAAQAPAGHTEHVWATGFQHELDACKGSVDMTPSFGVAVIGEHWSCGGRAFPTAEGTTVTLTGVLTGTYRVGPVVAVLNQRTNTTSDVPRGHDLLYQTCQGGDNSRMSFTALQRIG